MSFFVCPCLLLELNWFLSEWNIAFTLALDHSGPLTPSSAEPLHPLNRTQNSGKSNSKVLAPINHSSNPQLLPAEDRGRNMPPHPRLFEISVEEHFHIQAQPQQVSPPVHSDLYSPVCHTAAASKSCCFSRSQRFIYLLAFLQVVMGSLELYCPQSTKTVPVKSDRLTFK